MRESLKNRLSDFADALQQLFCPHTRTKDVFGGTERCRQCGKNLGKVK